jgi:hypothetical protein
VSHLLDREARMLDVNSFVLNHLLLCALPICDIEQSLSWRSGLDVGDFESASESIGG